MFLRFVPDFLRCSRDFPQVFPTVSLGFLQISPRCFQGFPQVSPRFPLGLPPVIPRLPQVFLRFSPGFPQSSPRFPQVSPRSISPRFSLGFPWFYPGAMGKTKRKNDGFHLPFHSMLAPFWLHFNSVLTSFCLPFWSIWPPFEGPGEGPRNIDEFCRFCSPSGLPFSSILAPISIPFSIKKLINFLIDF